MLTVLHFLISFAQDRHLCYSWWSFSELFSQVTDVCLVMSVLRALLASLSIPCLTTSIEQVLWTHDQGDYENVLRSWPMPSIFYLKRPTGAGYSIWFCRRILEQVSQVRNTWAKSMRMRHDSWKQTLVYYVRSSWHKDFPHPLFSIFLSCPFYFVSSSKQDHFCLHLR